MKMDNGAATSYVYAKVCGKLAKSWIGKRTSSLFAVRSVRELWNLVFPKVEMPSVPEVLLTRELEKQAFNSFITEIISLMEHFPKPSPTLVALIHFYDYENLKQAGSAKEASRIHCPEFQRITPFNLIDYDKWPLLDEMTGNSPVKWQEFDVGAKQVRMNEENLDRLYFRELYSSLKHLDSECRHELGNLLVWKMNMDNMIWALRLKVYYRMDRDEIVSQLLHVTDSPCEADPVCAEAYKILDLNPESLEDWKEWHYSKYLNSSDENGLWTLDVKALGKRIQTEYMKKIRAMFHKFPGTQAPLICYYLIKRQEMENIRTASESIRLNVDRHFAMQVSGILED